MRGWLRCVLIAICWISVPYGVSAWTTTPYDEAMFRADSAHTGVMPGPAPKETPVENWRFDIGDSGFYDPVVAENLVFVGGNGTGWNDCFLYAIDGSTGIERWRAPDLCGMTPAVADGLVFAIGDNGDHPTGNGEPNYFPPSWVVALEAQTGNIVWRFDTEDHFTSNITIDDDSLYVGGRTLKSPGPNTIDHAVVAALDDATGNLRWRTEVSNDKPETPEAADSTPAIVDGVLYVGIDFVGVVAMDAKSGREIWRSPFEGENSTPAVVDGSIFIGGNEGYVYGLNAVTGSLLWQFPVDDWVLASAAVANDTVFISSVDGILFALDAVTGKERWHVREVGGGSSATIVGNELLVGCVLGRSTPNSYGALIDFDVKTGREKWRIRTAPIVTSPVVVDGYIYLIERDGMLRVFGDSTT
jgi:eukaryotic-like serine/threonine-protein kinase